MTRFATSIAFFLSGAFLIAAEPSPDEQTNRLEISSAIVDAKSILTPKNGEFDLGSFCESVSFRFGPSTNVKWSPIRLRYKLEGYEANWHEGNCYMFLAARFFDKAGDLLSQKNFQAQKESTGWTGSLRTSSLTHRWEILDVPPKAARVMMVISSAGPPATVGVYVVDDLIVSRTSNTNGRPEVLLRTVLDPLAKIDDSKGLPDWVRDGSHPSMAKILEIGQESSRKALAILDEDPLGHAEWRNRIDSTAKVNPGDRLLIEWNEMYSMGVGDTRSGFYKDVPRGEYQFHLEEINVLGRPTGVETYAQVIIPLPVWEMPWFWATMATLMIGGAVGVGRYISWYRMRREIARLRQQRALEQERLRIAQDIHDDLGARVTQISMVSAMSQANSNYPEKARADFDRISSMSRDLVSALYETVWSVNPENDNLDALGSYVCQMSNKMCDSTPVRCRFDMLDLPTDILISSQVRHNIVMAIKEAVHNVIKHSKASEVMIGMRFSHPLLRISVEDNGCGFDSGESLPGNGLANMQRRLKEIGGDCKIETHPAKGAKIQITLALPPSN